MIVRCFNAIIWAMWFWCLFTCLFPLSAPWRESLCVVQWWRFALFDYYAMGDAYVWLVCALYSWKWKVVCESLHLFAETESWGVSLHCLFANLVDHDSSTYWVEICEVFADIEAFCETLSWTMARFVRVRVQECKCVAGNGSEKAANIWLRSKFPIFLSYQERLDPKGIFIFLILVTPWNLHTNKEYYGHNDLLVNQSCMWNQTLLIANHLPCYTGNFGKPVFAFCAQVATPGWIYYLT